MPGAVQRQAHLGPSPVGQQLCGDGLRLHTGRHVQRQAATARPLVLQRLGEAGERPLLRGTTAPTELLAWSEDNTRWPVSAACAATVAVSLSRISPTSITSGS